QGASGVGHESRHAFETSEHQRVDNAPAQAWPPQLAQAGLAPPIPGEGRPSIEPVSRARPALRFVRRQGLAIRRSRGPTPGRRLTVSLMLVSQATREAPGAASVSDAEASTVR